MADKPPVLYFNDACSTTVGGDYCIRLLRICEGDTGPEDKLVGELYMTFPTAVLLWRTLHSDIQANVDKLSEASGLGKTQIFDQLQTGSKDKLGLVNALAQLLKD